MFIRKIKSKNSITNIFNKGSCYNNNTNYPLVRNFHNTMSTLASSDEQRSKRHGKRQNNILNKEKTTIENYTYRSDKLTIEMIDVMSGQLGYHPFNIIDAIIISKNHPLVAVLYPLNHNKEVGDNYSKINSPKPFPTIFWMVSCVDMCCYY